MRFFAVLLAILPFAAFAQDGDKGIIINYLEDTLTSAGREVVITGFRGALSSEASLDRLTIADDDGIWLTLDNVVLDWNRSALFRGRVDVTTLRAENLTISRAPNTQGDADLPSPESTPFSLPDLPVAINVERFEVAQLALGAPILGQALELNITAALELANGSGLIDFLASRTDGRRGTFNVQASYDANTEVIDLDIALEEEAQGLAATLLELPNEPSLALSLRGSGPIDDFSGEFELATDGEPRLSGVVSQSRDPKGPARNFALDIAGDVTALFIPQYRAFFGPQVTLKAEGQQLSDGALNLDAFTLSARSLVLQGEARLDSDGWPKFLDVSGNIAAPDGGAVLLPIGGEGTRADAIDLTISHNRNVSENIRAEFVISNLDHPDVTIERQRVAFIGRINQGENRGVDGISGRIGLSALGLSLRDPALDAAVGARVAGGFDFIFNPGDPIAFRDLDIGGEDYNAVGDATVGSLASGLETDLDLTIKADDLGRFSQIAQRTLAGSGRLAVKGSIAPLSGAFDVVVVGDVDDLQIDQPQADAVLRGTTLLNIAARRDPSGTRIERAIVVNPALVAELSADLTSESSQVSYSFNLKRSELVAPGVSGPLNINGTAQGDGVDWRVDARASGPFAVNAKVDGLATGPNASLNFEASLPNLGVITPDLLGPLSATGQLRKIPNGWAISTNADGPSGTDAKVTGQFMASGRADLDIQGNAPLGLANPGLAPRNLRGIARFDLKLNGEPNLENLRGTITTQGARFVEPDLGLSLDNIRADISLANSTAQLALAGDVSSGGRLRVNGPVRLDGGFNANLNISVRDVTLLDPNLYKTSASGDIAVQGPLAQNAKISGQIEIGETQVQVPSTGLTSFGEIPDIVHVSALRPVARTLERAGLSTTPSQEVTGTTKGPAYPLDIVINAPARIFVRGRGLDAELGGRLRLSGTTSQVISNGQFRLIRGRLDILQQRFQLDEGLIQLQGGFIPFIRFRATTETQTGTASVFISGPANAPRVSFEATPDVPEDEVLALLLFGRDLTQISALQAVLLADAVATLAGRGGANIVGRLRDTFGLDDLDIVTDDAGNTQLNIGKYISDNVYTDVTVGSEGEADISINLDLTDSVTAKGSFGSDGDTSIGIFFEKDY